MKYREFYISLEIRRCAFVRICNAFAINLIYVSYFNLNLT